MKIVCIRHGETKANIEGRYSGWTETSLTKRGLRQFSDMAKFISNYEFDTIYSSPSKRCIDTAIGILNINRDELVIDEGLRESNFGIFEGKTYNEIQNQHKEQCKLWAQDYINYRIPNGESLNDVNQRVSAFLDDRISQNTNDLYITHGGIIRIIILKILDLPIDKFWSFKIKPGVVVELDYSEGFGILSSIWSPDG